VQSRPIVLSVLLAINILLGINLVSEILYQGQSQVVFAVFFILSVLQTLLFLRWPAKVWLRGLAIPLCFCMLETLFLSEPVTFHNIHFWFALLIIGALIVQGMRAAQVWFGILTVTYLANAYYVTQLFGKSYIMEVQYGPHLVSYFSFLLGMFATSWLLYAMLGRAYAGMREKTRELQHQQQELSKKNAVLDTYQQTLLDLTRKESALTAGMMDINRAVVTAARDALRVSQVSICYFLNQGEELQRQVFCSSSGIRSDGLTISRNEYPVYFNALQTKPVIAAPWVADHPDTAEFATTAADPADVVSMLDCPILLDREVLGVISCEQVGTAREWAPEDALFLQSLADFVALGWQNERIRNLVQQVREQNIDLTEKNHEIGALNEELTLVNDQQLQLNRTLEDAVRERTNELEIQNRQLAEYAFVNSHLLRAPLARILGLAHLIAQEATSVRDRELLEALESSANELDQVIRKIAALLYPGNNFSREDVKAILDRPPDKPGA